MRIQVAKPLFAWDCLEDSPTLKTIKQVLEILPDQTLLDSMQLARGKGRNDFSIRTLWGVLVLSIALRHTTIEGCLAELRRNESLRKLIGIESEDDVPNKWNLSRFLDALGAKCQSKGVTCVSVKERHLRVKNIAFKKDHDESKTGWRFGGGAWWLRFVKVKR